MEDCLPGSEALAAAALCLSLIAGGGCSPRTIVVVDPYPCEDAGAIGCPPALLDDLVGYWHLDDPTGSATARDSSGWGNDGTLAGLDPATAWVADGPEGRALSVQGLGYVDVPDSASIDSITTQVTVAAWMNLQGTIASGSYATAISRQIGTGFGQHYHLSVNSGLQAILFITTPDSGQQVLGSPTPVAQQTWLHLAGTYDGSEARLYVDGVEVASLPVSGAFAAETNPVILSGNGNEASRAVSELVPGQLDDVMLYRRALSADEVARIAGGALLPAGTRFDAGASGN
jgi:large repetitive protein